MTQLGKELDLERGYLTVFCWILVLFFCLSKLFDTLDIVVWFQKHTIHHRILAPAVFYLAINSPLTGNWSNADWQRELQHSVYSIVERNELKHKISRTYCWYISLTETTALFLTNCGSALLTANEKWGEGFPSTEKMALWISFLLSFYSE